MKYNIVLDETELRDLVEIYYKRRQAKIMERSKFDQEIESLSEKIAELSSKLGSGKSSSVNAYNADGTWVEKITWLLRHLGVPLRYGEIVDHIASFEPKKDKRVIQKSVLSVLSQNVGVRFEKEEGKFSLIKPKAEIEKPVTTKQTVLLA